MRALISGYLLFKSATKQRFTWFDVKLAKVLVSSQWLEDAPGWLTLIADLEREAPAPEAFGLWEYEIEQDIRTWWRRLRGKS